MIKIMKYGQVPNSQIFARVSEKTDVEDTVSAILADVKENGDAALISYCQKFDDVNTDVTVFLGNTPAVKMLFFISLFFCKFY